MTVICPTVSIEKEICPEKSQRDSLKELPINMKLKADNDASISLPRNLY